MSSQLDEDLLAHDIEKSGYLLKKTSKGLWVNRYFVTERNILSYWHDQNSFEQHDNPSEKYDIAEIKNVERTSNRGLVVNFLNSSKFKLEIRALMDNERNEWASILEGKAKLYSVDELLSDLRQHHISFRTRTFETLMFLHEKDQNKWILDRLDEIFEISADDSKSAQLRSNSSRLLSAACKALDEYIIACDDCKLEMSSREPKIVAHTRNYIKRYAEILKGRLTLELLYLPGVEQKSIEELGEKALCSALELAHRFDKLQTYSFVPKDLLSTMSKTLFNLGDVLSALIKLSVRRVDAFFEELSNTATAQRSKRLCDMISLLNEMISSIRDDIHDASLFRLTLQQMLQTQLLAFSDHFSLLDLAPYEELSLMDHIRTCDKIFEQLSKVAFDLNTRILLKDGIPQEADMEQYLTVSPSVLDSIKSTCDDSARQAFLRSVYILQDAKKYLLENMFHELADGWMGGILCKALVNTLSQWVDMVREIMPRKFVRVTFVETSRLMIIMYINRMVTLHQAKKSTTLSPRGIQQMKSDLKTIYSWVAENTLPEECIAEKKLLQILFQEGFVTCSDSDALQVFAMATRWFGVKHEYAIYDLFRLVLKYRSDISTKVRKAILAVCNEYLHQLHNAIQTDPQLLQGEITNTNILDILFPSAGIEHCTGAKWKMEKSSDPTATKLTVTLVVTDTINEAMEFRRRAQMLSIAAAGISNKETNEMNQKREDQQTNISAVPVSPPSLESSSSSTSNRVPPPRPPPPPPRRATVVGLPTPAVTTATPAAPPSLGKLGLFEEVSAENCDSEKDLFHSEVSSQKPFVEPDDSSKEKQVLIADIKDQQAPAPPGTTPSAKLPPPAKPQRRATAPAISAAMMAQAIDGQSRKEVTEQDAIAILLQSAKKRLVENE